MANAFFTVPTPKNEPVRAYEPGSEDRAGVKKALETIKKNPEEIPVVIGGERIWDRPKTPVRAPHNQKLELGQVAGATADDAQKAIDAALEARREWAAMPWEQRAAVFLKAADLLTTRYRATMNAATMLGQSKTVHQAEIEAVCELADFWRFNVHCMEQLFHEQPISPDLIWNRTEMRGLEGFVFAVSPFNFTAISLNLPSAPALTGCSVVWKPAPQAILASWWGYKILEEAGLPPGVINFVPGEPGPIGDVALKSPDLSGVHFTGSTRTFNHLWKSVGENLDRYKTYPRIVGETGGKDFVFAHTSCDREALKANLIRGAFEYQGQKCSAVSRVYVPESVWSEIRDDLIDEVNKVKMGDVEDFRNFMGAVIDDRAFKKITGYIDHAKDDPNAEILAGGEYDDSTGYFVRPTIIQAKDPKYKSMVEEIFGPVMTVYVYKDKDFEKTLKLCDESTGYGLTGGIFAQDRRVIRQMTDALEHTAGNFYVNDKPTGAIVGQQPFGGARGSGTNDKAGTKLNIQRWLSMRAIKENFVPARDYRYPFMGDS